MRNMFENAVRENRGVNLEDVAEFEADLEADRARKRARYE